jgi:hypothetical protein
MNLAALDWELTEGLAQRRKEAEALAARAHLVRELRRARRAGRTHWWSRLLAH